MWSFDLLFLRCWNFWAGQRQRQLHWSFGPRLVLVFVAVGAVSKEAKTYKNRLAKKSQKAGNQKPEAA